MGAFNAPPPACRGLKHNSQHNRSISGQRQQSHLRYTLPVNRRTRASPKEPCTTVPAYRACVCWGFSGASAAKAIKGRVSTDIGNMELWARGWRIYFSELTVSFKPQGKFLNSLYFEHPWSKSAITYRLHPQHISQHYKQKRKPRNDTIDNLNQSSFHKPACQCQGHLRTESLSASAHILHCGKIRPWVVRSGFRA